MLPTIGQMIQIQLQTSANENQYLKSRIADHKNNQLFIDPPIDDKGLFKLLHSGDILNVSYMDSSANYSFSTRVINHKIENSLHLFSIAVPERSQITRVQRRSFLRVEANLEVAIRLGDQRLLAITEDLSGGGLSMIIHDDKAKLLQDDKVQCWLLLQFRNGSLEHIPFQAEVVRTKKVDNGLLVMLRFVNILEPDRQKVVKYCLDRQIELKK